MVMVRCLKNVTLGELGVAYVEGREYDIPAKQANSYGEYFEKMQTKPKNKAKKTTENK